jgi:hypothetical protein
VLKRRGGKIVGYSGWTALRREKCGIFAQSKNCEASRGSRCCANTSVVRQQICKHTIRDIAEKRANATIEKLLEAVFFVRSMPWLYNEAGHPVPDGYKYGDLAPQVWGSLESETVKLWS